MDPTPVGGWRRFTGRVSSASGPAPPGSTSDATAVTAPRPGTWDSVDPPFSAPTPSVSWSEDPFGVPSEDRSGTSS